MMGTAYDEMSNRPEAIKEYQAAEQADTNFMGVHSGLGFEYWREGENEVAEKEFRAELQRFPSDPVSNCILGLILLDKSRPAEAEPHFRAALAANPRYAEALFGLGKTELALQHPQAAVEPLRKAIGIDPNYFEAHFVLGSVLRQLGETAAAANEQKIALGIQEKRRAEAIKRNEIR
jgi:tetratricopeptide (TPR) repeat protein